MDSRKLFGTDGIRGIAGEYPLQKSTLQLIGLYSSLSFKKYFSTNKIFIGTDTRESSKWITNSLVKPFLSNGYDVFFLDVFPTAGVSYISKKFSAIGIVVSASHNPYEFNGIKFFSPSGTKIADEIENEIEYLVKNKPKIKKGTSNKKLINCYDQAEKEYINFLISCFYSNLQKEKLSQKNLQLVVDCANGSTYKIAAKIFKRIFDSCKIVNISPNGKNINSNCGSMFPNEIKKYLGNNSIGICFDGDGDRVIFLDEKKYIRDGDYIIGILATEFKKNKKLKNSLVIPTIMSNLGLLKYLWSKGIKTILAPVGDKNVYDYIINYSANLGGEQSGHIIINDYLSTGDGILTSLEILKIIINNNKCLYELCKIFNKYPQVIKNIEVSYKPEIETIFPRNFLKNIERKIEGRIFLRYSGTEPLLRIMVEGKDKSKVEKTVEDLTMHFKRVCNNTNQ